MSRHRRALATIAVAAVFDVIAGVLYAAVEHVSVWLALYWSVTTATTVGYGDVTPKTGTGHIIAALVMLTIVPLFAATFSLFTSGLTAVHIEKGHDMLRHIIHHHPEIPEL